MIEAICMCLSLQSGFLYPLQWHSQHEYYSIYTLKVVLSNVKEAVPQDFRLPALQPYGLP